MTLSNSFLLRPLSHTCRAERTCLHVQAAMGDHVTLRMTLLCLHERVNNGVESAGAHQCAPPRAARSAPAETFLSARTPVTAPPSPKEPHRCGAAGVCVEQRWQHSCTTVYSQTSHNTISSLNTHEPEKLLLQSPQQLLHLVAICGTAP